jgi:hypothetical protein
MKKLLILIAMFAATSVYALESRQECCANNTCCTPEQCDSINIPVYIVDGVEVQNLNDITPDDIIKVDVTKDPAITRIFSPRLGGVVFITTKSKKYLTPILENYNNMTEEQRQQRIPGELRIR